MSAAAQGAAPAAAGPRSTRASYARYTAAVGATALIAVVVAAATGSPRPWASDDVFWVLAALCLLGEALPIRLTRRARYDEVTVSTAFAFAVLLCFGALPAMVLFGCATLIVDAPARHAVRVVFNVAQYVVTMAAAAAVLALTTGAAGPVDLVGDLHGIVLAAVALFGVNHVLAGVGAAILMRRPIGPYLLADLGFHAWAAGFQLALAPVLVACAQVHTLLVPLVFLPVLAIYFGGREAVTNQHRALHDELTDLPNRQLFNRRLAEEIDGARESGGRFALVLADLDDFKAVNDSLGHDLGDGLLGRVGERLRAAAPADAVVARLGGDEFAVLLPGLDAAGGLDVAARMAEDLEEPVDVESFSLDVRASFGISVFPAHGGDGHVLLKHADVALRRAKDTGRRYEDFKDSDVTSFDRLALAAELRRGIEAGELVLHYQPKLALDGTRSDGVEALVRWQHPHLGLVSPEGFIPLAEQSNLIKPLTLWVLDEALRQCAAWRQGGFDLRVAVNLSTRSLLDRALAGQVAGLLAKHDLPPSALQLEVTETKIVADFGRAQAVLHELRSLGVRVAIDDFGTGYSSLAQLQQLPADELKIDKSFVMDMDVNANNAAIVRSTIDLGRNLGLEVTAEGVETEETRDLLQQLGCDYVQGYLLGRPAPADACERDILREASQRRFPRSGGSHPVGSEVAA
jgi:diguanylate cyclase (GGDEF)-like protein